MEENITSLTPWYGRKEEPIVWRITRDGFSLRSFTDVPYFDIFHERRRTKHGGIVNKKGRVVINQNQRSKVLYNYVYVNGT